MMDLISYSPPFQHVIAHILSLLRGMIKVVIVFNIIALNYIEGK